MRPRPANTFALAISLSLLMAGTGLVAGHEQRIDVTGARPLHAMLKEIEKRYDVIVTYEDIPYFHSSEVTDVTAARRPDSPKRLFEPKGGAFTFTPPASPENPYDMRALVSNVINAYNKTHSNSVFEVAWADGALHVFPTMALDRNGVLQPYRSILDVVISVPPGDKSGTDTLSDILAGVGNSGARRLLNATNVWNLLDQLKFTGGFDRVNARTAIMSVVSRVGRPQSWQIMCQPGEGEACYFSMTAPGVW